MILGPVRWILAPLATSRLWSLAVSGSSVKGGSGCCRLMEGVPRKGAAPPRGSLLESDHAKGLRPHAVPDEEPDPCLWLRHGNTSWLNNIHGIH